MAKSRRQSTAKTLNDGSYRLEGLEIEACDCQTLCPCVLGDDPDEGGCQGILVRRITDGQIGTVNVSGVTWLEVFQSPGNMNLGKIRKVVYIDSESIEQFEAVRAAIEGSLGGPLGDLAKLTSNLLDVNQATIEVEAEHGDGRVASTGKLRAVFSPLRGEDGTPTTIRDARFSSVPDTPAWLSKASELTVVLPDYGIQFAYQGRSAIQGQFKFAK
jgi:hypothetical protein